MKRVCFAVVLILVEKACAIKAPSLVVATLPPFPFSNSSYPFSYSCEYILVHGDIYGGLSGSSEIDGYMDGWMIVP